MAVEVEIDVEVLKNEIKKTYASVSEEPDRDFIFPTGRAWAKDLHYPAELARVPDREAVERARQSLPAELAKRVTYQVASGKEIELEPLSFDLVVFSWSL